MSRLAFSVDTHLLRELGALLVGRNSTALVELLKNAYDADATSVVVHGERLADRGSITVADNGHGMTFADFETKFLRIAGRSKEFSERRSPRFQRKYTGAKGIGRLSAHKLAEELAVESRPDLTVLGRKRDSLGVKALINWNAIEENTSSMDDAREIVATAETGTGSPGTTLELRSLHSEWTSRQLNEFLAEIRSTRADDAILARLPQDLFPYVSLLGDIEQSDSGSHDPGFRIELSGELAGTTRQWPTLLSHVNWVIEILATTDRIEYQIAPSAVTATVYKDATVRTFGARRETPGPSFVARILVRDGSGQGNSRLPDALTQFARESSGVRLYYEGFRVLPYGAPRNDWLGVDQASVRREPLNVSEALLNRPERSEQDERTYQLSNSSYFGGVFLHDRDSAGLQMVVNREGFLPSDSFDDLVAAVRRGIDLSVRIRAALGAKNKADAEREEVARRTREVNALLNAESIPSSPTATKADRRQAWLEAGKAAASQLRTQAAPSSDEAQRNVAIVAAALDQISSEVSESLDERAQLRILASLGTQIGTFVHEVNGVLGQARVIRDLLEQLAAANPAISRDILDIRRAQSEVIATLERQAIYLSDSMGAEARRRRVRQPVRDRLSTAIRLLGGSASQRSIEIIDEVPPGLKTPPMFAAELNIIFANLLSNAIKAAAATGDGTEHGGRIAVSASKTPSGVYILIQNTGTAVSLRESERWFSPFETTTLDVDPVLGQGLGLGLTLTRRIVEEYGGQVQFVEPEAEYATAIEVSLPDR